MSIEMPYEIINLESSHLIKTKVITKCFLLHSLKNSTIHKIRIDFNSILFYPTQRTDCKAVVSTLPGQTLGPDGLQLTFSLSKIHMPRMWVENHPDKDSQVQKDPSLKIL